VSSRWVTIASLVTTSSFWGTSREILEPQFPESHELNGTKGMKVQDVCGERVVSVLLLEWRETHHESPSSRPRRPVETLAFSSLVTAFFLA
jgi:hypothetical protein